MICPSCKGTGLRLNPTLPVLIESGKSIHVINPHGQPIWVPCDACIGGIASCCDTGWYEDDPQPKVRRG